MSRRAKCTDQVIKEISQAMLVGNYFEAACAVGGITPRTGFSWRQKAQELIDTNTEPSGSNERRYLQFLHAVEAAELQSEAVLVAKVQAGTTDNPRLALDLLARRFPQRWGNRVAVEGSVDGELAALLANIATAAMSREPKRGNEE